MTWRDSFLAALGIGDLSSGQQEYYRQQRQDYEYAQRMRQAQQQQLAEQQQQLWSMGMANMKSPEWAERSQPANVQKGLDAWERAVTTAFKAVRDRNEKAFIEGSENPNLAWLDRRIDEVRVAL